MRSVKNPLTSIAIALLLLIAFTCAGDTLKSSDWPDTGVQWTSYTNVETWSTLYFTNFPVFPYTGVRAAAMTEPERAPQASRHAKWLDRRRARLARKKPPLVPPERRIMPYFTIGYPAGTYKELPTGQGWARCYLDAATTVVPAGSFVQGDQYVIVYSVLEKSDYDEYLYAAYDVRDADDFKRLEWDRTCYEISAACYAQVIGRDGTPVSPDGNLIMHGDFTMLKLREQRDGFTGEWYTISSARSDDLSGELPVVGLLDCGRTVMISGRLIEVDGFKPWTMRFGGDAVSNIVAYVEGSTLKKLAWPSWCSGKYSSMASGHRTSGRENRYIHAFRDNRVWRLLPR